MWYTCFTSFKYTFAKQNFLYLAPLQMARTYQTARKSTGGRAYARRTPVEPQQEEVPVPPVQEDAPAQPEEPLAPREDHPDAAANALGGDDEEVLGRDYYFEEDQDGRIMEVDEEGNLRSPLPSPTPAQEPVPPPV